MTKTPKNLSSIDNFELVYPEALSMVVHRVLNKDFDNTIDADLQDEQQYYFNVMAIVFLKLEPALCVTFHMAISSYEAENLVLMAKEVLTAMFDCDTILDKVMIFDVGSQENIGSLSIKALEEKYDAISDIMDDEDTMQNRTIH